MTPSDPIAAMQRRQFLAAGAAMSLAGGCANTPPPADGAALDAEFDRFVADWLRLAPERATALQHFSGAEQEALDSQLDPIGQVHRQRVLALAQDGLALTQRWLARKLSPDQRAAVATVRWNLERARDTAPCADHAFAFDQLRGLQVRSVNLLAVAHPLRRAADLQSWLSRLAQLPERCDQAIGLTRSAAARGLLPPRFILERGRDQIAALLRPAAERSVFVSALASRTASLRELPAAERERALRRAIQLVEQGVQPAFERARALLDELHPRCGSEAGLWRLPGGDAAYVQALRSQTSTTLGADEIHDIGWREVRRIEAQMDRLLQGIGRRDGSVDSRLQALVAEQQPPAVSDPRAWMIARFAEYVRETQERSAGLFKRMPSTPVEVRREPELTERTASPRYGPPAPDGSRPGIFWVPLPGPDFEIVGMKSMVIHEAVPGHHFQFALLVERRELPRWRWRVFGAVPANSEGWALYTEQLAIEQGWYEGDVLQLLGALSLQRLRARRLVVDTGLHARRWTREQAIAMGISAQEVERCVVNPGQACACMIGMRHILQLREEAKTALGPNFNLPAFHDSVLAAGLVPLTVMSEVVRGWVAAA